MPSGQPNTTHRSSAGSRRSSSSRRRSASSNSGTLSWTASTWRRLRRSASRSGASTRGSARYKPRRQMPSDPQPVSVRRSPAMLGAPLDEHLSPSSRISVIVPRGDQSREKFFFTFNPSGLSSPREIDSGPRCRSVPQRHQGDRDTVSRGDPPHASTRRSGVRTGSSRSMSSRKAAYAIWPSDTPAKWGSL